MASRSSARSPASDQAVAAAHGEEVQGAILDVNLGGTPIYPVADALEARGIPFVFVTGYSASSIDRRYARIPVFEKPVQPDKLGELLANWRLGAAEVTRSLSELQPGQIVGLNRAAREVRKSLGLAGRSRSTSSGSQAFPSSP